MKDDPNLKIISGVRVESIDQKNKCLFLNNREILHYQRLVIASGGRPIVPDVFSSRDCGGIFPVRSLNIARQARKWLPDHPEIVVVGGGLVGVKTAVHLAGHGFSITLIERETQLLPQALSRNASQLIQAHLEQKKIRLLLGSTVEDIQSSGKAIKAVQANGKWVPCQTLFVAAGSVPELDLLKDSDLLQENRLEVTPALQTRDKNIFAAGDVVTIVNNGHFTPWTWPQAVVQGKLAAANLYSSAPMPLTCLSRANTMNLNGLSLVGLGAPVSNTETYVYSIPKAGIYRELFHCDGKIVGGVLIGDISNAGRLHTIMNINEKVKTGFDELLKPRNDTFLKNSPTCAKHKRRASILLPQGV
jgi:NAD(P)H-nitrite reductase large subunit